MPPSSSPGFDFRCEGVYGLTGSGKTTFALMRAFEASSLGYAIYTNVRFDPRAVRHHLLRRVTRRYLSRRSLTRRLVDAWHYIYEDDVATFWTSTSVGPALVLIDEAHLWFPQVAQSRGEDPQFIAYLSQHRKLRHHVMMCTQYHTMLSHSFRKIQHIHWEVKNLRHIPVDIGLMKIPLPLDGFAYSAYYRDHHGERIDGRTIMAMNPDNRWIWSLFQTAELHAGMKTLIHGAS